MVSTFQYVLAMVAVLGGALGYNPNDQVGADIDYGTFQDPSVHVRPRFRYWIPDASVDLDEVAADFAAVKAVGMGEMELLGYYLYGNYPYATPVPTDWTIYGWGTDAWKRLQDTCLQATKDLGMLMDFSLGPDQGAGVPVDQNDPGVMWDLWPFNVSVPIGGTFDGVLPGWDTVTNGEFVAATIGLVTSSTPATFSAHPGWEGPYFYNGSDSIVVASSLEDVTDQVDSSGRLNLTFPATASGLEYRVFAFYQNHTNYHEQAPPWYIEANAPGSALQSAVNDFRQNGSSLVDHFSAAGAQVVIDFWESYLLGNGSRELIQEIGNYAWEDSQEFGAGTLVWWTPNLLKAFRASRGYDLTKFLPLIYSENNQLPAPLASPNHYYTDEADKGQVHINDYWQVLTELNQIYLASFANWTTQALQSQYTAQVSYNLPMDMLANVPHVNAPECESLGFGHLIDGYRQYTGPANLAGKRIISSELGAQGGEAYPQTLPELIWDIKRSIVGSVNQFVLHGYPFSGAYPNTTYPGFTTFTFEFSNMHGPRQPSWEYYDDYMNWIARTQYIAQSGVPKIDLAFWLKLDAYPAFGITNQYMPNDLQQAGYSYEYLTPDNFDLPEAYIAHGALAPERQAFKALVLRANDTLTVPGVQKLVDFAHAGLTIVISGGLPQNLIGFNVSGGTEYVRSALASIASLDNVHIVPFDNLAVSLANLGITPRTRVSADRVLNTYVREDAAAATTYFYIYNDAYQVPMGEGASTGAIKFEATGVPYIYDAWTGDVIPILGYQQDTATTTVPVSLAGNQSMIIGFHHDESPPPGTTILSLPSGVYSGAAQSGYPGPSVTVKAGNTTGPILLSNGTTVKLPAPAVSSNLTAWTLIVESWSTPTTPDTNFQADRSNTTYNITGLRAWNEISPALFKVSGRGFYSTTFEWLGGNGTAGSADGAMLSLGVLVQTARVFVNGHQMPPLDPTDAITDIGNCLVAGTNTLEIVVSTTLGNALRPIQDSILTSGQPWTGPPPLVQGYGLVEPVLLLPYSIVNISL
ncbi:hypothetical protein LTR56_008282 [Elasticomyces elasticus]|nr:hypothetical protein LTR56_008282 [Elasticomyces elasticus]KAK3661845.1 hypothetical protein LTR22_007428 [Elasticomyces elasticus]KAK4924449.1 hypothetical protein LTR49_008540 [Elasticomyces elasticus]KAK5762586.1 hypothetical protein LTS12_007176 [Elasticomyces elasticus]